MSKGTRMRLVIEKQPEGTRSPEDERLIAQIVGLERRTARGGKDSIDHAGRSRV